MCKKTETLEIRLDNLKAIPNIDNFSPFLNFNLVDIQHDVEKVIKYS